jgi:3D (Asp-Asp-Asp) domain-containing protein
MRNDWESAVVVDPRELRRLQEETSRLRGAHRRQRIGLCVLAGLSLFSTSGFGWKTTQHAEAAREARVYRKEAMHSNNVLTALARSHEHILAATQQAPSVGTKSWGRRFTVTMYLPRSEAYGKFNDGLTATMTKADPKRRIVAVDPKLIPYGSWVWIEELGWYRAEDCGSAIKGFRLDLLTATEKEAMTFGKQDRFVIVVPPANA